MALLFQLLVIIANGNIAGDGSTNITGINEITAAAILLRTENGN